MAKDDSSEEEEEGTTEEGFEAGERGGEETRGKQGELRELDGGEDGAEIEGGASEVRGGEEGTVGGASGKRRKEISSTE